MLIVDNNVIFYYPSHYPLIMQNISQSSSLVFASETVKFLPFSKLT